MRWKTGPWRAPRLVQGVKRQLVECVSEGNVFDGAAIQSSALRDRETKLLQLPAEFLEDLLLSRVNGLVADPRGVRLANCMITGSLDLTRAAMQPEQVDRAVLPLRCERVVFQEPIRLDYATTGAICLTHCRLPGFHARGADISTELTLDDCTLYRRTADVVSRHRVIDIDGATIGGDFSATNLADEEAAPDTPEAAATPTGAKGQDRGFGPVPFAHILVDADNAKISGGVDLSCVGLSSGDRHGAPAVLMGNFDNADIFGDFRAIGTRFAPTAPEDAYRHPAPRDRRRKALDLRGAHVRGDVELDYVQTSGEIHLEDATLTQDLSLGGARLVHVVAESGLAGVVVEAMGLSVGGSVHFVDRRGADATLPPAEPEENGGKRDVRLLAIGQIRLTRARIGGDLDASGATICAVGRVVEGVALDMRSVELGGTLYLDGRRDVGPGLFIGMVNLNHISVSGSVIFSGSWFRAPAGQQMGPQRIHLQVLSESHADAEPSDENEHEWSLVDCKHVARTDRELADWRKNQLWRTSFSVARPEDRSKGRESPVDLADREQPSSASQPTGEMRGLLNELGVLPALDLSRQDLWRLRGGCRAIAMVDARVTGSVLFGIGPVAWGKDNKKGDARAKDDAGNTEDTNNTEDAVTNTSSSVNGDANGKGRDGPSVVVGCVDLDRIRIDGTLRLTGGVFRAVTPLTPQNSHEPEGANTRDSESPPDVSMSYPSTPGWTELKARVCLSLRSARLNGRLDTKYFGPIQMGGENNARSGYKPMLEAYGWTANRGRKVPKVLSGALYERRRVLHIVPEYEALEKFIPDPGRPISPDQAGDWSIAVNRPAGFVDEMVCLLDLAAIAESIDDRAVGASLPPLPTVHDVAGWYSLRPDGLFDLSGAAIASIHDHPCHGWPTSDGHLELNGCTYNYISLNHDTSYLLASDNAGQGEEAGQSGKRSRKALLRRPDGPTERRGTSVGRRFVGWIHWRLAITRRLFWYVLFAIRYGSCRLCRYFGLRSPHKPSCAKEFPKYARERYRLLTVRYIEYAVASFRIRIDDRSTPQDRRIKWLEQQYPGAGPRKQDFRPQPYEQLAGIMRATGFSLDADGIAAAKRNMRWRAGVFGIVQRQFDKLLWLTCKYTYSPTRIVSWVVGLILLAVLISGGAYDRMMLSSGSGSGEFSPWLYAGDVIIPIVEFGYVDQWSVEEPSSCVQGPASLPPFERAAGTESAFAQTWLFGPYLAWASDAVFSVLGIGGARGVEWAFGLLTGFGSLFTALLVITLTGVMRRD